MPTAPVSLTRMVVEVFIHILSWTFVFISPLFFHPDSSSFTLADHIHGFIFPVVSCIIFYINYLWLVPKYYMRGRYRAFFLLNILFILILMGGADYVRATFPRMHHFGRSPHPRGESPSSFFWVFMKLRNFVSYAFIAAMAVFISLSKAWGHAEIARKQSEVDRKEAELKNLRNQINPHFLLNTLNNIYALTGFDTEKAQTAILELSKMLRYLLYENDDAEVNLNKEIDFLQNYISLMRIRLSERVKIETDFQVPPTTSAVVAPLIFISLVENAFKHGVSPTKPCFIHIHISTTDEAIIFRCENSNFPKQNNDKSPGGIGLQQVSSRLELAYPGRYTWEHGTRDNETVFFSNIIIRKGK